MVRQNPVIAFYDYVADIYDLIVRRKWETVKAKNSKYWLVKHFEKNKVSTILDCGCGTGIDVIALGRRGYTCTGCDISKGMLQIANSNASKYTVNNNCKFVNCSITELSQHFQADQFDAVTCIGNVLMHLSEKDQIYKALREISFVLKPNGKCLITLDDNYDWLKTLLGNREVIFHIEGFLPAEQPLVPFHIWPLESEVVKSYVIIYGLDKQSRWRVKRRFYLPLKLIFLKQLLRMMRRTGFTDIGASYIEDGYLNHDITDYWICSKWTRERTPILIEGKK